jgi:hypothetical protein
VLSAAKFSNLNDLFDKNFGMKVGESLIAPEALNRT